MFLCFFSTLLSEQNQEDLEISKEFFDSESQLSEDSGLSQLFEEETLPAQPEAQLESPREAQPEAAQAQQTPPTEIKHFPWFVLSCVLVYVGMFIFTMLKKNCPKKLYLRRHVFLVFLADSHFNPLTKIHY
jgi:hypothetical protein